jgi:metal transporter CNNM
MSTAPAAPQGGVGAGLLQSAGKDAKDGVLALQAGYGTIGSTPPDSKRPKTPSKGHQSVSEIDHDPSTPIKSNEDTPTNRRPAPSTSKSRPTSQSTLGSLQSRDSPTRSRTKRGAVRSGSITENIIDRDGIKKVVLETTSSSDDSGSGGARVDGQEEEREENKRPEPSSEEPTSGGKKKRRRRKRKADKSSEEERGLLERDDE